MGFFLSSVCKETYRHQHSRALIVTLCPSHCQRETPTSPSLCCHWEAQISLSIFTLFIFIFSKSPLPCRFLSLPQVIHSLSLPPQRTLSHVHADHPTTCFVLDYLCWTLSEFWIFLFCSNPLLYVFDHHDTNTKKNRIVLKNLYLWKWFLVFF